MKVSAIFSVSATVAVVLTQSASAHVMAWARGMYCLNGSDPSVNDQNTNLAVNPLYDLPKEKWWFQADRGCDKAPPSPGDVLELPAGGSFEVEFAINRAFTTLSYDGKQATEWTGGEKYPSDWKGKNPPECLGPLHAESESKAAGTAFAISYVSDIKDVTMENLVVFTTLAHTPWKRKGVYQVPKYMPACPPQGCMCAWLWVPDGCGQPNMYMAGYRCTVTGAATGYKLAQAKPPVYCADDKSKCVKGAKQMIAWNQQTGDNVKTPPGKSPGYNEGCGWSNGAQDDIFVEVGNDDDDDSLSVPSSTPAPSQTFAPSQPPAPVASSPAPSTPAPQPSSTDKPSVTPSTAPTQTPKPSRHTPKPSGCKRATARPREIEDDESDY
ncbi:hypothetical protein Poli38472_004853 [Pythium oligandrum]|uniref:Proteophosphoglycan ppg4 n=1 Tax=Pythium oligandrum TaxID=41045 RepID=A0A8K1CAK1_PYTOL|nr:hypothetical protein Poli38472_004853 [Pythium oligandrum]|eukprot:TMW59784.1 hypothetical protein Poli38472_004853 [Pythium oligandrum]